MLIFYINSFLSKIGKIYYIWESLKNNKEAILIFLANKENIFNEYIKKLKCNICNCTFKIKSYPFIEKTINYYLEGKYKELNISYKFLIGSNFEKKVWSTLAKIPYGKVVTYKNIAKDAGYPFAWRATGKAICRNTMMLVIPCKRVIK